MQYTIQTGLFAAYVLPVFEDYSHNFIPFRYSLWSAGSILTVCQENNGMSYPRRTECSKVRCQAQDGVTVDILLASIKKWDPLHFINTFN